jgi:cation-transporting P-type ATPase D
VALETDTEQQAGGACAPANGHLDRDPSICDNSNQAISKNAVKKISLLGHGHHGKQVVELLLSNGGEEAINQFCQRWRQVFVEAVHPRYLPSGWNINHRLVAFHTRPFLSQGCRKTLFPMHTDWLYDCLNFLVLRIGQDIS